MSSKLGQELKLDYLPVAIILADELPAEAVQLKPSKEARGCSLTALRAAANGETVYLCVDTPSCPGMKSGMGFSDRPNMPGGIEYFLSCGRGEGFPKGERLKKTPEVAKAYYDRLPVGVMDKKYVIFKPLTESDKDKASLVTFVVNPDQLSALVTLHAFESDTLDTTYMPMSSGCSTIVRLPLAETMKEASRAIIGLADIFARPLFGPDKLAFTVSYQDYERMESYADDCFFQAETWDGVKERL